VNRTAWIGGLAATGALALAGCGGSDNSSGGSGASSTGSSGSSSSSGTAGTTKSGSGGGGAIRLAADPGGKLAFDTKALTAKAGKVTVRFANASGIPHAVEIEGKGVEKVTKTITKGNASLTADLKPGTYKFYCPVDGHRQAGMEGTLTVK